MTLTIQDFERETVISWDNSTNTAIITTFNRAMVTKLDKFCKTHPNHYKVINEMVYDEKVEGKEYSCSKNLVSVRPPAKSKMTEEHKQMASERMAQKQAEKKKTKQN